MSETKNERKNTRRFSTIVPYLRESHRYLWFGGFFIILTNVLSLTTPFVLKSVTDLLDQGEVSSPLLNSYLGWFSPDDTMSTVLYLLLLMLGLSLAAGLFRFLVRRTIIWMSRNVEYHLRDDLVSHLLILPQSFYHQNRTGDIMARATNDLEAVRMMIGPGIMHTANTVVGLVVALGFMLTMSPKLTAYALIPMLIFPYAVNRLGNLIHRKFTRIQ
jgi:ATP-binding cassette subfamily B protein